MQTGLTNIEYDNELRHYFDKDNDPYISYQDALDGIRKKEHKLRKEKLIKITYTGLTNNFIVEDVARNYRIKSLVVKMIDYSVKDNSHDDLCQYIYEYLLTYDNIRLNQMYNDNKLRNFISQIIKQQRDGGHKGNNTIYQTQLHIKENNSYTFEYADYEDRSEYDITADILIKYIDKKAEMIDGQEYTSEELKTILAFTLLKKYFMSDLTQVALAKHLMISRITIGKLMKIAREDTIKWFTKYGSTYDS